MFKIALCLLFVASMVYSQPDDGSWTLEDRQRMDHRSTAVECGRVAMDSVCNNHRQTMGKGVECSHMIPLMQCVFDYAEEVCAVSELEMLESSGIKTEWLRRRGGDCLDVVDFVEEYGYYD